MRNHLGNFDGLYEQYIKPNEESFRENYLKSCLFDKIKYENCMLDFVPISHDEYLVIDKEVGQFRGTYTVGCLQSEPAENTVSSILIADEWDIRKVMPVIFSKNWNSIYFVLNQSAAKFASFFKLRDFLNQLPSTVRFFMDTEEMRQYFLTDHNAYLPRKIVGTQSEKYGEIFKEIHDIRIKSGVPSNNVFLSICIPSYNRGKLALQAVEAVLASQYDAEIEVVVCDNGSIADIEGYQEIEKNKDSRIRYYRFPENGGYRYNIMNCLHKAKGKFALFTSDEDIIISENLEIALEWLSNHLSDTGTCIFSSIMDDAHQWTTLKEETFEPGVDAVIRAYHTNYITGTCLNLDRIKELDLFQREETLLENYYNIIYTHCTLSVFLGLRFKIVNSDIVLWRYGEVCAQSHDWGETGKIVNFSLPENRSLLMFDAIKLIKSEVSERELLEIVENRLNTHYVMLSNLYTLPKVSSSFLKMYRWVDICVSHYKKCLRFFEELEAEGIILDLPAFIAKLDKMTFYWLVCKRQQRLCTPEENLLSSLQAQVAKYYYDKGTPFEEIDFEGIEKRLNSLVKEFLH